MSNLKPFVQKPSKEIKIDQQEMDIIKKNNVIVDELTFLFGKNRATYISKERVLSNKMDEIHAEIQEYMKVITDKYKIIGNIKQVDFTENKIILE